MSRRRLIVYGSLLTAGGIVCWLLPLFHVRPLGGPKSRAPQPAPTGPDTAPEDPAAYAGRVWESPLRTGEGSPELTRLLNAMDADPAEARARYGNQAGLGGGWYFCVRGRGTVESVEKKRVVLKLDHTPRRAGLELGAVIDSTVRQALGVKPSDFANSQEFNQVSAELNRRVEEEVIAPNREVLMPGVVVEFVGCTRIDGRQDLDRLRVVPIRLEVRGVAEADSAPSAEEDGSS